jgi:aspartate carbamoyltransferase catalytic subunit
VVNKKITSIDDLSAREIDGIADLAIKFQKSKKNYSNKSPKNIFNLFLEPSTRTTVSFELAARKLGHKVININFEKSSLSKGETFEDTMDTLISMGPDLLIIRDKNNYSPHNISSKHKIRVINAGDGTNEHPTQALLDYAVIKSIFKKKKIKIGICGDIKHSRVAHSNIKLFTKMGFDIHLIAPNYFLDKSNLKNLNPNMTYHKNLNSLKKVDVLMMLRVQKERIHKSANNLMNNFKKDFCLSSKHLTYKPYLMHPGPVNRNIEISDAVMDQYPKSLVLKQVNMGVYVRMACLKFLLGK